MKEKATWNSFLQDVSGSQGNHKDPQYPQLVAQLANDSQNMGYHMNIKLHFLHLHLSYFPEKLGALSEEQGSASIKTLMLWKFSIKDNIMLL